MNAPPDDLLEVSAHAYHPRDRGNSHGARHLVVRQDYKKGRLSRSKGDALCKPRRKFWDLVCYGETYPATCKRCRDIASRHGLPLPHEASEGEA